MDVKSALVTTGARAGSAGRAAVAVLLLTLRARPRKLVESVAAMVVGGWRWAERLRGKGWKI